MRARAGRSPVIADVARVAGVSVPTVSRVLTGAARVGEDKRRRVVAAIDELGYRPSAAARALASGKPRLLSVVTGDTSKYGYTQTIQGVEEAARSAGYAVIITVVESADPAVVDGAVASLLSQSVAGVVVLNFDPQGLAVSKRLPPDLPVVLVSGSRVEGVPHATLDEAQAAEDLTDHLLDLGHATVHHVSVPHAGEKDLRAAGWRTALERRGLAVPPIITATWEPESGRQVGLGLVERPDITAVFCGNDEIAIGLLRGVVQTGRRVPQDVSVVGFDDHPLSAYWSPPLTTVDLDFSGLGARAYTLLVQALAGDDSAPVSSARPPLVLRETAGPPPTPR